MNNIIILILLIVVLIFFIGLIITVNSVCIQYLCTDNNPTSTDTIEKVGIFKIRKKNKSS